MTSSSSRALLKALFSYPKPLLLGHRGAKDYAPENTLKAFDLALLHGCHGIEFDVRLTKDSRAVICHDKRFKRIEISRAHYSTLANKGILLLEDVLARFVGRAFLDVELKVAGLERISLELLSEFQPKAGVVITSFLPEVLRNVRALDSAMPVGLICSKPEHLKEARTLPLSAIVLHHSLVNRDLLERFHNNDILVLVWGSNRLSQMRKIVSFGVDGLIVDDTILAARSFNPLARTTGNRETRPLQ